ncbi:SDR family NAD(P)-dependent oxidoreductase [Phenylobacterium sp.]|uniref:SDR family NAD(P)-dependent oxidoreductase n=1 Tax=Phenylobacterium sp. TaxID=1871053 RepID=UPI002CB81A04|nr:SDR family NAD(P)-dependent oxidoreductase [Phenylobacterium sp.]HVI33608.1 SDR family NAD(P)-dependent oxidoreductase [Phenylobacterium sp.]
MAAVSPTGTLSGRRALVTGATRGIGRAIAEALAASGAHVIVTGRDEARARDVANALEASGASGADYLAADLEDDDAVGELIPRVQADFGPLDILVNNAGIDADNPLISHPLEDWRRIMKVNLEVPFRLGQAVAPQFIEKGAGVIINIASILGLSPTMDAAAYVPAKHGLIGLTRQMALEWAGSGVRVNAIAPGLIQTDMTSGVWGTPAGDAYVQHKIPAGRIGQPQDIGALAAFLASDAASFIHGETIVVDGGGLLS